MKIRIRTKLAAALAVPLVALLAVAGFVALEAADEARAVRAETELAMVSLGPSSLSTELQNERNYTALDLIGLAEAATLEVSSVEEARARVDRSLEALEVFLQDRDPIVQDAFAPAFAALEQLEATRTSYDRYGGAKDLANQELADDVFRSYTTMTEALFTATSTVAVSVDDTVLRNGVEIVDQSNRRGELLANITRLVVLDALTDGDEERFEAEAAARVDRLRGHEERIRQLSTGPYADVATETLERDFDVTAKGMFDDYLAGEAVDLTGLLAAVSAGGADDVTSPAEMAADILAAEADTVRTAAADRQQLFWLLALAVVALAIIVTWAVTRSITQPLKALRDGADDMARRRLPEAVRGLLDTPLGEDVTLPEVEPIVVKTRDEVSEVVSVLNDVQRTTLALAADQAVLRRNIADSFVNLGRRNQNLLDRQLEFISELEQDETDPDELDALFRLDHLATRMRRNAESLLVLAGSESPRQWSAPVDIGDVVRSSLGEVEHYRRVNVRHLDAAAVTGAIAAGLAHLLAELVENALRYSPPEDDVEIKGRCVSGGYVLAIDDNGIGMSPADLERANLRLSGAESYTVAPSRYLGHYVAGSLATRLGIEVELQDSPAGGITAKIVIPSSNIHEDWPLTIQPPEAVESAAEQAAVGALPSPSSLDEALGAGRLAEIVSVDDLTRAIDEGRPAANAAASEERTAPVEPPPAVTADGLPKRVPGAQRPDLVPIVSRATRPAPAEAPVARAEPATSDDEGTATELPRAFGFLTAFADGATRAAADTDHDVPSEDR